MTRQIKPSPAFETSENLLRQMREANEKLVVATVHAEQLAEEAEAARATAADSEERFRSLVVASSTIVWRADARGRIEPERDGWFTLTGIALHEPPREADWVDAVHPEDRPRVQATWREAIATRTFYTCEHRIRRAKGGYAWVTARAVPILRDGVAREWIGTLTDITERIEIERAREQFMAILSHDLRGPLAAISLSADTLKLLALHGPYGTLVDEIGNTSKRMGALVHDIMDFARTRLGSGIPIVSRPCNLAAIATGIVDEISRVHPDRVIVTSSDGDLDGEWDRGRLGQVVANLLQNAVTHGTGEVQLSLRGLADEVQISIASHGEQIHPDALARLFEPFSRQITQGGGLGLGLYIVNELVHAHGGAVRVTSNDDTTVFAVTLPRRARSTEI